MSEHNPHINNKLSDSEKTNQGSYYTPISLVETIWKWIKPYLNEDCIILDSAAGYGAFLKQSSGYHSIGIDIDSDAVDKLNNYSHVIAKQGNALEYIDRIHWGIPEGKPLIVIGNPPYNDVTSKNKRSHKTKKIEIHPKIKSRDYGVAFLKSYCELNANYVCILHPWAYLIKKANFNQLKQFAGNYKLIRGAIFSSSFFPDTKTTPFPVIIGLYERNAFGMNYEDISNYPFEILEDSASQFCLSKVETIDDYIRKYPPTSNMNPISDIGLYFYSVRDTNSLITSANFSEKEKFDQQITVNYADFYKYAYLSCYKRYFGKHYIFGNLSPIVHRHTLEEDLEFQSACCIDSVINNSKIRLFKKTQFLERLRDDILRKNTSTKKYPDIAPFIETWLDNREIEKNSFEKFFRKYFDKLRKSYNSASNGTSSIV